MQQHGNCTLCPGAWPSFASAIVKHKLISHVGSKSSEMQQVEIIWFFIMGRIQVQGGVLCMATEFAVL